MFTGLIQAVGTVAQRSDRPDVSDLAIDPGGWAHRPEVGASIAVSGCCLTVVACESRLIRFQMVPETRERTTLGALRPGTRVNLEHAATPSTLLGGHLVTGHIDGVATVGPVAPDGRVRFHPPPDLMQYLCPKGSVAVEGVSLTVAHVEPVRGWFEVALIPATRRATTLGDLTEGDRVNIECDVLVKSVVHWLRHYAPGR